MFSPRFLRFSLLLLVGLTGCGTDDRYLHDGSPIDLANTQLTLETWNQLTEGPEKYDPELLERLHQEEPSLKTAEAWKTFQKDVVKPGLKQALGK